MTYNPAIYGTPDYTVDTLSELVTAMGSATAGETIRLNDGFNAATRWTFSKNNTGADIVVFAQSYLGASFASGIDIDDNSHNLVFAGMDVRGSTRIQGTNSGSSGFEFHWGRSYDNPVNPASINVWADLGGSIGFDICYDFTGSVSDGLIQNWRFEALGGGGIDFDFGSANWVVNQCTCEDLGTDFIQSGIQTKLVVANTTYIGRMWGSISPEDGGVDEKTGHVDVLQQLTSIDELYFVGNVFITTGGVKIGNQYIFIDTDNIATKAVVEHNINFCFNFHGLTKFGNNASFGSTSRVRWNTQLTNAQWTSARIIFSNASTTSPNVYAPISQNGSGDTVDGNSNILLDPTTDYDTQLAIYFDNPPDTVAIPTDGSETSNTIANMKLKTAYAASGSGRPNGYIDISGYLAEAGLGTPAPPGTAPVAISPTMTNQSFQEYTGPQTFSTSSNFTGTGIVYSINAVTGASINSSTGVITFNTGLMDVQAGTTITVTATNTTSPPATATLDVTITANTTPRVGMRINCNVL